MKGTTKTPGRSSTATGSSRKRQDTTLDFAETRVELFTDPPAIRWRESRGSKQDRKALSRNSRSSCSAKACAHGGDGFGACNATVPQIGEPGVDTFEFLARGTVDARGVAPRCRGAASASSR